ncbi:hypothetical protein BC827DRAFT_1379317 [Russula dissimulans]|nr:hypothetical protein BC827DRAFT_1379317 [Russula dissimulans]
MQTWPGESLAAIQVKQKARLQLEHILDEMSKKCTCGAAAAKLTPVPSLPPHLPSSTTSSPFEREEETVKGEAPSKRRRTTPPLISEPSAVPAKPAPVPEAASTPENAEAQKVAEAVVSSDKQVAPQPQPVQQQSTLPPESTPHEPESEPA